MEMKIFLIAAVVILSGPIAQAKLIDIKNFGILICSDPAEKIVEGVRLFPFVFEGTYSKFELLKNGEIYFSTFTENYFKNFANNQFAPGKPKVLVFDGATFDDHNLNMELDFTAEGPPYYLTYILNGKNLKLDCVNQ